MIVSSSNRPERSLNVGEVVLGSSMPGLRPNLVNAACSRLAAHLALSFLTFLLHSSGGRTWREGVSCEGNAIGPGLVSANVSIVLFG